MKSIRRFHVYVYFTPWDGQPCYVGKGKGKRFEEHFSLGERHPNVLFRELFITARHLGMQLICVKIRDQLTNEEAIEVECALIKTIGRMDLGTGPLVNLTDGGQGIEGLIFSESSRQKMRTSHLGKKHSEEQKMKIGNAHRGMKRSSATCQNISAALVGKKYRPRTDEEKANLSRCNAGKYVPPEVGLKISDAKRGKKRLPFSAEWKKRISDGMKAHKANQRALRSFIIEFS